MSEVVKSAAREARETASRLKNSPWWGDPHQEITVPLREAYRRQDWITLGYGSWEQYLVGEFGDDGLIFGHAAVPDATPSADTRSVYFIRPVGGGLIKIGVAGDVHVRCASIQLMCPVVLEIVAIIPGLGQQFEAGLHKRFAHARRHGEWFEPVPELLTYIAENGVRP